MSRTRRRKSRAKATAAAAVHARVTARGTSASDVSIRPSIMRPTSSLIAPVGSQRAASARGLLAIPNMGARETRTTGTE